jgi:Domain of unknown function (DUF222)
LCLNEGKDKIKHMFASPSFPDVHEARIRLQAVVERLVPGEVPLGEVTEMWEAFAAIERNAAAAKTLLAVRVEEARAGDASPEQHLARKAGTTRSAVRRVIETSKRLRALPATEAALRRGELSPQQAEAVADAAAANPDAERSLLDTARAGTLRQLRDAAVRAKAAADPDPDATHRRIHRERRLRTYTGPDGAWHLQACGTADAGAMVNAALEPIIDQIFRAARREGRHESREAYAFDALVALARGTSATPLADNTASARRPSVPDHTLAPDEAPTVDGSSTAGSAHPLHRRKPTNPSFLALLRVDLEALVRGRVAGGETCEIAGVGPVPARVARELLGEAVLKLVVTRGTDVANVTSLGRGPTAAQRVALLWNTPACTNSECDHTLAIQYDHRTPWAHDRVTELGNLDRLCPRPCHYRKTHEGWALVPGSGRRPLVPPGDPRHPASASAGADPPACTRP